MPRLTSVTSGVAVFVSDETAALLGADWVPVEEPKQPTKKSGK